MCLSCCAESATESIFLSLHSVLRALEGCKLIESKKHHRRGNIHVDNAVAALSTSVAITKRTMIFSILKNYTRGARTRTVEWTSKINFKFTLRDWLGTPLCIRLSTVNAFGVRILDDPYGWGVQYHVYVHRLCRIFRV